MEIKIITQAADYVVVDKPAPMLVHPNKPGNPLTVQDHLERALAGELAGTDRRISIINRLDRETSGVVLAATTPETARRFYAAMHDRQAEKVYRALVWGWPEDDVFSRDDPIAFARDHGPTPVYLKRMIHPDGDPAFTRFRVRERFRLRTTNGERFALVEARPETGRMHQIRVHLAACGFPVVGDKIYGPDSRLYVEFIERGWAPHIRDRLLLRRHALHNCRLTLHIAPPAPGRPYDWESPWPRDLAQWIEARRI